MYNGTLHRALRLDYIDPEWVERVAELWTNMMQEDGLTSEKINPQITAFRKAYEPLQMFTVELVKYGFPQFILGLVSSLFLVFRSL